MASSSTILALGTFSPSVLLRTARRTGALANRGLQVEEVPVPSSPAQFRALAAGELHAVLTSPDNLLAYRFLPANPLGSTRDVRIVSAVDRGLGLALYTRPGVGAVAELRGAEVGVDVAASGFAFALYEILGHAGLSRSDYQVVELGSTPQRLQALLDGRCAATMLNAGNDLRADEARLVRLADVIEFASPYLGTVLAVQGEPTAPTLALADALRETAAAVLSGAARSVAVEEAAGTGLAAHLAEQYVQRLADPERGLVAGGAVDQASLAVVIDLRRRHMSPEVAVLLEAALDPASGLVAAAGADSAGAGR
jgi:ABC-type nitrate/sulfonate/bicarbonate transport system substrate-binding protein